MIPSELVDKATCRARDAATRVPRATATLRVPPGSDAARWLLGSAAERLLESVLNDAVDLAKIINDDGEIERLEKIAYDVRHILRTRRLALKMLAVDGRTEEEAKTFTEAADRMRGGS